MCAQIENSLLQHGEDFNAYIDYRMKNVKPVMQAVVSGKDFTLFAYEYHQC